MWSEAAGPFRRRSRAGFNSWLTLFAQVFWRCSSNLRWEVSQELVPASGPPLPPQNGQNIILSSCRILENHWQIFRWGRAVALTHCEAVLGKWARWARRKGGGVSARCWFHPQFNLFSGPQHPASLLFHSSISRVDSVNSQKTCFPPLSSVSRCLHACVAPQANTLAFFRRGPSVYRRAAAARELLAPRQTAALYLCSKWAS